MSFYRPLDHTRNEVRMLTIVDSPPRDMFGLVHCKLENVSLDDLTDDFAQFLDKSSLPFNEVATRSWLEKTLERTDNVQPSTGDIKLEPWRWKIDNGDNATILKGWNHILRAIGIDPSECPRIPGRTRNTMTASATPRDPTVQQKLYLNPRFRWGDFEAISYCWESEVREKKIVVNQAVLEVPRNLEALLQRLRWLPDAKSGMRFWVDALCIDQGNVAEKNHQVQLMQSIYARAYAVIVWLGEGSVQSDKAIELISSINRFTLQDNEETRGYVKFGDILWHSYSMLPWNDLVDFFSRSYWRRLWIIQELALNHNMTLFLCGQRQLSRSMILRSSEFYQRKSVLIDGVVSRGSGGKVSSSMYGSIWPIIFQVNCLITTKGQGKEPSGQPIYIDGYPHRPKSSATAERPSLSVVLDLCRKARVTDPRDKIYGILGLLPENIAVSITPDYTLSHKQVFCQFVRTLLEENDGLEAILSWCRFDASSSMSSWIPDWTKPFTRNHIQWLRRRKAAGSSAAQWSISEDTKYLHCRGFIFDSIHDVSRPLPDVSNLSYRAGALNKSNQNHQLTNSPFANRYVNSRHLRSDLWRTLRQDHPFRRDIRKTCLDIPYDRDTDDRSPYNSKYYSIPDTITSNVSWETFNAFRQANADFDVCGAKFSDFFGKRDPSWTYLVMEERTNPEYAEILGQMAGDMHLIVLALTGRRLATTATGYLGMVPEEASKGDVIAVLYGCNFPVVLRRCGERYLFIGECYVDGVMDGELMEAQSRGEHEEREITLC